MPIFPPDTPTPPGDPPVSFSRAGMYGPEIFVDEDMVLFRTQPVHVYEEGTTTHITLYYDRTKDTVAPNPFTTDSYGNGYFFADPGQYDIVHGTIRYPAVVHADPIEAMGGGPPTGVAGGELAGTYPNPTLSVAKNAEISGKADGAGTTAALATKTDKATLGANQVLVADVASTPLGRTMGASTVLARLASGGIVAATPAQMKTLLAIAEADVTNLTTDLGAIATALADRVPISGHVANTVPVATGTSIADLVMGASTILARLASGNIIAATPAQLKTLLAVVAADISDFTTETRARGNFVTCANSASRPASPFNGQMCLQVDDFILLGYRSSVTEWIPLRPNKKNDRKIPSNYSIALSSGIVDWPNPVGGGYSGPATVTIKKYAASTVLQITVHSSQWIAGTDQGASADIVVDIGGVDTLVVNAFLNAVGNHFTVSGTVPIASLAVGTYTCKVQCSTSASGGLSQVLSVDGNDQTVIVVEEVLP